MRAKTSNGASDYEFNTSVNLLKKSAALTQRDRQDFAECIKRAGVSLSTTAFDRSGTGPGAGEEAKTAGCGVTGEAMEGTSGAGTNIVKQKQVMEARDVQEQVAGVSEVEAMQKADVESSGAKVLVALSRARATVHICAHGHGSHKRTYLYAARCGRTCAMPG